MFWSTSQWEQDYVLLPPHRRRCVSQWLLGVLGLDLRSSRLQINVDPFQQRRWQLYCSFHLDDKHGKGSGMRRRSGVMKDINQGSRSDILLLTKRDGVRGGSLGLLKNTYQAMSTAFSGHLPPPPFFFYSTLKALETYFLNQLLTMSYGPFIKTKCSAKDKQFWLFQFRGFCVTHISVHRQEQWKHNLNWISWQMFVFEPWLANFCHYQR